MSMVDASEAADAAPTRDVGLGDDAAVADAGLIDASRPDAALPVATRSHWRSALYPANWTPSLTDGQGRFLHDFSYAGYQRSEQPIPHVTTNVIDVTAPPYSADPTGVTEATAAIQAAVDAAAQAGGGVVFLPAGTYRVRPSATARGAIEIAASNVVLRGEGRAQTYLYNDETSMRGKAVVYVAPSPSGSWLTPAATPVSLTADADSRAVELQVANSSGFAIGQRVIVRADATDDWAREHGLEGLWNASNVQGPTFMRRITAINGSYITIDVPLRYPVRMRDAARIYVAATQLEGIGIEDLSIGMRQHTGTTGWGDTDYTVAGTPAYEVHASAAIKIVHAEHSWVQRVGTYRPAANTDDLHLLSHGIQLSQSRHITIRDCLLERPQYKGGGGNGYGVILDGSDNLVERCAATRARHAFSFRKMWTHGNVVRDSLSVEARLATDFHMHFSMANLLENLTMDGDFIDASFRNCCTGPHGHTTSQTVIWNTRGRRYVSGRDIIVDSRQFGWGYVIGTSGPAYGVRTTPTIDSSYETAPEDWVEGVGEGDALWPRSLFADQLHRRLHSTPQLTAAPLSMHAPTKDTYVRGGATNQTVNFGAETTLVVKDANEPFRRQAYMTFDLSTISSPIRSAQLVVRGLVSDQGGTEAELRAVAVANDSWAELGLTYLGRPSLGALQSRLVVDSTRADRVLDVSAHVRGEHAADGLATLGLWQDEDGDGLALSLSSREGSDPPRLEVSLADHHPLSITGIDGDPPDTVTTIAGAADGDLATRWSNDTRGAQLTVDLGAVRVVEGVGVAHYRGDERIHFFEIHTSLDGMTWAPGVTAFSNGADAAIEPRDMSPRPARYVRYIGYGNSTNAWNSVTELVPYGW